MTWLLIKSILGKASDWILAHWQLVLFALMALAIWNYKSSYEATTREFDLFKTNIVQLAKAQEAQNAVKLAQAKTKQAESNAIANQQISQLHINQDTLTNAIRSYYAPNNSKPIMASGSGIVLPSSSNSESTSEVASSGQGLASGEPVTDPACTGLQAQLRTLEEAASLETILYNKARSRIDQDCAQIGCED